MKQFTKLEAIEEMQEIGSHSIFLIESRDLITAICAPFGFLPPWQRFTPDKNDPKGAQPNWINETETWDWSPFDGVDGHRVASLLNLACNAQPSQALGRGTAYREDLSNAKATLG